MLGRPELRTPRIRAWRKFGSPGLNQLLDQLETELQQDSGFEDGETTSVHKVLNGIQLVPHPSGP